MSISVIVNEGTSFEVQADFTDASGAPVTPTTVEYRVDDIFTGKEIRTWTSLTPAESVTVPIAPEDTAILNDDRAEEQRTVTIKAPYGASEQITESIDFAIKNLRFL